MYRLLTETKNGFIVESLVDGKRFPVFASARVSSMEEISIYSTGEEDISIKEIFKALREKEDAGTPIDPRADQDELVALFAEAVPEYDPDRVYFSDIKKVFNWYALLKDKDMLSFEEEEQEEEGAKDEAPETAPGKEEDPEEKESKE